MTRRVVIAVEPFPHVTRTAVEQFELFYPPSSTLDGLEAGGRVLDALNAGHAIDSEAALRLAGRKPHTHAGPSSSYVLHAERTGLFVLVDNPGQKAVVTFLRFFSRTQHEHAVTLFGAGAAVTADVHWAKQPAPVAVHPLPAIPASIVPPPKVEFTSPVARALGGRIEARKRLPEIEAGTLTHVDGHRIVVIEGKDGVRRVSLDERLPPREPRAVLVERPPVVLFTDPAARALGGRIEARKRFAEIEAGTLTHVAGHRIVVDRTGGVPRVGLEAPPPVPPPPRPPVLDQQATPLARGKREVSRSTLPRLGGLRLPDLVTPPGQTTAERVRTRLAISQAPDDAWVGDGEGWRVTVGDDVFHVHDMGDGWRVYREPPPPFDPHHVAMARELRAAGWGVVAPDVVAARRPCGAPTTTAEGGRDDA